ncbi:pleckstrin homology domain-containing family G member 4B [Pteronotus mesoamericanus]|uniref:pleckstrin homology domain-containing family G member 4B n=1 Tax=Pteronotus mesoamericanus TaxID=1884717 RepID=UPI0023ED679F|nr:pleckstrin homology domain-containing family G member 4B [Pteronotus parnellii mesoamericanus]
MALSADGSGDKGSSAQDLESLDTYIQNTLSALYPPFEATAATVLWQVFSVAERLHGGDGLRCLTDFLIPAKRALQHLQQEACARYTGLIFFHEGWPLCIHGKVVVQLASLRGVRLRPGDFYLQVTSVGKQSARLVLKCLSQLGRGSEEVAVPEAMYGCVFTGEFLDQVNRERSSALLKNCLLTSGSTVYRTPWSNVTVPVFVPTSGRALTSRSSHPGPEQPPGSASEAPALAPAMASPCLQESTSSSNTATLPPCAGHPGSDQPSHLAYVRRAECESPRTLPRSSGVGPREPSESLEGPGGKLDPMDKKDGPQALTSPEDTDSPRKRPPEVPAAMETRRWFRKSYMEALRNPMPLGSSSEESLVDEASSTQSKRSGAVASPTQKGTPGPQGDSQGIWSQGSCPGTAGRTLTRRSRSLDRSLRSVQGDVQQASPHSSCAGPRGLLGGQAVGTRNLHSSQPSVCTTEKAGVNTDGCSFQGHNPSKFPDVLAELLCPEGEGQPPSTGGLPSQVPGQVLETNSELLQSGAVILPGTRDRQGRAVVQVCTRSPLWSSHHMSSAELSRLLKYLHGIPRKEVRDLGLVILVDARKSPASPALSQALAALQNTSPPIIHSILLLVGKESAFRPDKAAAIQCEVVGSLKALHKFVDSSQLTVDLEGSFPYSHSDWICFRRKLEPFTTNCRDAIAFLQSLIGSLNTHRTLNTAQEITESISEHKAIMKRVLEDELLVALRLEGGTVLARLRREERGASEDSRDSIEAASQLYNQVDEEIHRLVLTSNRCLQELESLRELRTLQEESDQQCCQKGRPLMEENDSKDTEETVQDAGRRLSASAGQAEWREGELAQCIRQSQFCETVNGTKRHCSECLERLGPGLVAEYLKSCHQEAMGVSANTAVVGLGGQQALAQWHALRLQCQQAPLHSQEALSEAAPGPGPLPLDQSPLKRELVQGAEMRHREASWIPPTDPEGHTGEWARLLSSLPGQVALCGQGGEHLDPGVHDPDNSSTCSSEPTQTPTIHHRKHPVKKIMKKTLSFEIPQLDSGPRDSHWPGHTGVFIKGLEVTSTVASEKKPSLRAPAESPPVTLNRSLSSPSRIQPSEGDRRRPAGSSRLQHIMAEMISTEREYVRSLGYVVDNYFPEMERVDLPQDLRGKRSVIFGNLEKLYNFHRHHFLTELERCRHCPLAVGHVFLKHEEQFGMYVLYSKNKPQSDALLCSHGHAFFKDKQRALGDKMDLASYLLKPVQRMGKYALLLQDLVREARRCPAREQEQGELKAAEDMLRFQLRHGNDLLAMDAVRGCDVNLKEQGQLRCRDEFIVCCGRKKYLRHVFLFDDLILFSKTRKVDGGYDIYTYKQSFKMAEIGMTETVGDSGVKFEIWFRRRRKSQESYVLQASSPEVKAMWTDMIGKILWQQALRNRELRMREMVSVGLGSKPFLDVKASEAAINDRAVSYTVNGTESRTQVAIAVPPRNHTTPFKRPHSTISDSSTSSSSSQSSATLYVSTSQAHCPWPYDVHTCIEEDELEQETGSQTPLRTESSESSQCVSGDSSPGQPRLSRPLPPGLFSDEGPQGTSPTLLRRDPQPQLDGGQSTTPSYHLGMARPPFRPPCTAPPPPFILRGHPAPASRSHHGGSTRTPAPVQRPRHS